MRSKDTEFAAVELRTSNETYELQINFRNCRAMRQNASLLLYVDMNADNGTKMHIDFHDGSSTYPNFFVECDIIVQTHDVGSDCTLGVTPWTSMQAHWQGLSHHLMRRALDNI